MVLRHRAPRHRTAAGPAHRRGARRLGRRSRLTRPHRLDRDRRPARGLADAAAASHGACPSRGGPGGGRPAPAFRGCRGDLHPGLPLPLPGLAPAVRRVRRQHAGARAHHDVQHGRTPRALAWHERAAAPGTLPRRLRGPLPGEPRLYDARPARGAVDRSGRAAAGAPRTDRSDPGRRDLPLHGAAGLDLPARLHVVRRGEGAQ